jgi:hypothetical protein
MQILRTFNKLKNLDGRIKTFRFTQEPWVRVLRPILSRLRTFRLPKNLDGKTLKYIIPGFLTFLILFSGGGVLAANTTINVPNPIGATSVIEIIDRITNYLMWIAIVLAPMMIIIAAFTFLTAAGNTRKVDSAKKMLLWALVGLTLVLVSKGIVNVLKEFLGSTI